MPRVHRIQTTFTSGELDPKLKRRGDIAHFYNGAEKLRNVIVLPHGGVTRRPGLEYVNTLTKQLNELTVSGYTVTAPNGGVASNASDGDLTTKVTSTAVIGTTDPYVLLHIDTGAAVDCLFFDIYSLALTSGSTNDSENEWGVQWSSDDAAWNDLGNSIDLLEANMSIRTRRFTDSAQATISARYWRVVRIGATDLGSGKAELTEVKMWVENATESEVRLIDFAFSTTQTYLLVATDENIRVYSGGVYQCDVPLFTHSSHLDTLSWTQNLDTLLTFQDHHPTQKFQRQGADDEWGVTEWVYNNIPTFDFGDGAEAIWSATRGWPVSGVFFQGRLWLGGTQSRPSSIFASKSGDPEDFDIGSGADDDAIFVTADTDQVNAFFRVNAGRHLQFFASGGEFYVPISEDQGVTPSNIILRRTSTNGSAPGLRVFNIEGAVMFIQAGKKAIREFLYVDTEQAYQANIISLLSSHLIVSPIDLALRPGTSTDENNMLLIVNGDGSLCTFVTLRSQDIAAFSLQTTEGNFLAANVEGSTMYFAIDRTVEGATVRYLERFDPTLYLDCSVNAAMTSESFTATASQTVFTYTFTSPATTDLIAVWQNGTRLVEGDSYTVDLGAKTVTLLIGATVDDIIKINQMVSIVTGLDHLEGENVGCRVDGFTQINQTVASGQITLDMAAAETYEIGLDFPDVTGSGHGVWVKDMPVEAQLPEGTAVGRKVRIVEVIASLFETKHLVIQENIVPFRAFGDDLLDQPIPLFSGDKKVEAILGWDDTGQVNVNQTEPQPMTLIGLTKKVAI